MRTRFLICEQCGNVTALIRDCGVPITCCGKKMREISPSHEGDGAKEKHAPIIEKNKEEVTVSVGSEEHPMTAEHYIEQICLTTSEGFMCKHLTPESPPRAVFHISDNEKVVAAYAFCNKHGAWESLYAAADGAF